MPDITNRARNFDTPISWTQLSQFPNMEKRAKMDPEDPGGSWRIIYILTDKRNATTKNKVFYSSNNFE